MLSRHIEAPSYGNCRAILTILIDNRTELGKVPPAAYQIRKVTY